MRKGNEEGKMFFKYCPRCKGVKGFTMTQVKKEVGLWTKLTCAECGLTADYKLTPAEIVKFLAENEP